MPVLSRDYGRFMPWYRLYIRRHDHKMRLVEQGTGKPVHVEAILPIKAGLIVRPRGEYGVCLFRDEIHVVSEFPDLER